MKYKELEEYLFSNRDQKFALFSKSLSNSDYISIGIKNPILKDIIKKHKDDLELKLEEFVLGKYLEIDFIYYGLSLSRLNTIDEQLLFLKNNIKNAKSWAITDCVPPFLKKLSFDKYYDFFLDTYNSNNTYEERISYVLGLKYYKEKEVLKIIPLIKLNKEYMVMMAEAWLLSVIAITYPTDVFDFLKSIDDITLKRKTISKICDSRRIEEGLKNKFKSLR